MIQKCPICEGHGLVPGGFYNAVVGQLHWTSDRAVETCRTCNGVGTLVSCQSCGTQALPGPMSGCARQPCPEHTVCPPRIR